MSSSATSPLRARPSSGGAGYTPQQAANYTRRSEAGSVVVDDLLQGMNEWRNIQDVIRSTFKALHDVIKAQGDAVKSLERQLEAKASSADVQAALLRKANISDVNRSLTDITHALEGKASVYDLEQKPDRTELQVALKAKANVDQVAAELGSKVERDDFEAARHTNERQIVTLAAQAEEQQRDMERRVTKDELQTVLGNKLDLSAFGDRFGASHSSSASVAQLLEHKAGREEVEGLRELLVKNVEEVRRMNDEIRREHTTTKDEARDHNAEQIRKVHARVDAVHKETAAALTPLAQEQEDLSAKLEALMREMAAVMSEQQEAAREASRELTEMMSNASEALNSKVTRVERESAEARDEIARKAAADAQAVRVQLERSLEGSVSELEALIQLSARRDDVVKALEGKSATEDLDGLRVGIARQIETVQKQLSLKADREQLDGKCGFDDLEESVGIQEQAIKRMAEMIETVQKDMDRDMGWAQEAIASKADKPDVVKCIEDIQRKADLKDVTLLVDAKADVDEVNRALLDVNGQLHLKASMSDISATLQEQALLNSALISELCLGRWIWKSLKTKTGGAVPWNIQIANSDPANLIWEKDKPYVTCVTPGLYEVHFGFYSRKRPVVKVHVNGEPVLTIAGKSETVTHHAGGRLQSSGRYTNSNITGLTHVDFVALPARARISMSYQGDDDAEGFMGLKKL